MRTPIVCVALWLLICSCGTNESKPEVNSPASKSYFPIAEYVKGEITIVDSLPLGILKKTIRGSRRDSSFIEGTEFRALATEFAGPALEKESLESKFKENAFMDNTTGYLTFNYEPAVADAPYERIDVLVKPGESIDKVNSIYLQKSYKQDDTTINERLYWKARTSFSITKEKKYKDQAPVIEQLLVIWDPSAY